MRALMLIVLLIALVAKRSWVASRLGLGKPAVKAAATTPRFPLQMLLKTRTAHRYDLIPVIVETRNAAGQLAPLPKPPIIEVFYDGELQPTVGQVEALRPRYDHKHHHYVAWWPVPWRAKPGVYTVEARCSLPEPEQWDWGKPLKVKASKGTAAKSAALAEMVCRATFRLKGRRPARIPPGFCAVTWEGHIPTGRVRKPDGSYGDWRALVDWAEYMGADALWCRGGITEVNRNWSLSMEEPFAPVDDAMVRKLAHEAHRRGLRFGTWVVAYATFPHNRNAGKPPYRFAQIVRPDGSVTSHDFISLLDPDRPGHLAEFLHKKAQDPDIDMVGLDYFRPDRGGFEVTDQFARQMPVKLPRDFFSRSQRERWKYVAHKVGYQWRSDPNFYEQWNWFRAHLLSQRLEEIRRKAQLTKPLWIFMFGWFHGQQIGQDPYMLTDAGADALAVMLYQVESLQHFELMTNQWREYMEAGNCNLLPGDQVDFFWHQKMTRPRMAPEELYRRIIVAHRSFQRGSVCIGTFWHDISRAIGGRVAPYSGREWALAGAAAFSAVRRSWKVQPLAAELVAPKSVTAGVPFSVKVRMKSLVKTPVTGLHLTLEPTPQVTAVGSSSKTVAELPAGAEMTVPWTITVRSLDASRGNRFMVAFRLTWDSGAWEEELPRQAPRVLVVFKGMDAH